MAPLTALMGRTCGEACWLARQEVCRCACGGQNHGCKLVNGAPLPGRTKRVKEVRYRLAAVITWAQRFDYRSLEHSSHWAFQVVPKECKWPEVQHAGDGAEFAWIEDTYTLEQAEAEMVAAKAKEDAKRKVYHLKECDGVKMHYQHPKIANPCGNPEYHN